MCFFTLFLYVKRHIRFLYYSFSSLTQTNEKADANSTKNTSNEYFQRQKQREFRSNILGNATIFLARFRILISDVFLGLFIYFFKLLHFRVIEGEVIAFSSLFSGLLCFRVIFWVIVFLVIVLVIEFLGYFFSLFF